MTNQRKRSLVRLHAGLLCKTRAFYRAMMMGRAGGRSGFRGRKSLAVRCNAMHTARRFGLNCTLRLDFEFSKPGTPSRSIDNTKSRYQSNHMHPYIGCGSTQSDFLSIVWYNTIVLFLSIGPTLIGMPAIMVRGAFAEPPLVGCAPQARICAPRRAHHSACCAACLPALLS